jgi:aspartyl-tRNA(Asn)/glutamyl-tRNA(Gln) amidotransferase subunit A
VSQQAPQQGSSRSALAPPATQSGAALPTALIDLTAAQAARAIRDRTISPIELIETLVARAREVDGQIQAWETLDVERALEAARNAENRRTDGGPLDLLHGVPFGVKDIFDTAGLRTAAGFGPYDRRVPTPDADVVARMRAAGGIVLGKMVATQFAFTDPSRTHNPWSPVHTPGGSSSGSGAGVAAREVPWAIGSQTAGSVLRPAAYNGAVGFKPTHGLISTRGGTPLAWSLDTVGIITRSVEDCALFLIATQAPPAAGSGEPGPADGRKRPHLGLLAECLDVANPEVRAHVQEIATRLERAGASVREVHLPHPFDLIQAVHYVTMRSELAAAYWQLWSEYSGDFRPVLRAGVQAGRLLPAHAYLHAQRLRAPITMALAQGLGGADGIDAYLLPTAVNTAPGMETTGDPSLQVPATLTGIPSISLPTGLSAEGLPLAVQLVGSPGQDAALLDVAAWCEAELDRMPAPDVAKAQGRESAR